VNQTTERPVRVLCTLPWASRSGGAEEIFQGVVTGGPENGYQIQTVFFEEGPWPGELRAEGVASEVVAAGRLREGQKYLATVARLAAILRRSQPDVILNWTAKTQLYGAPAAILVGMADRVFWWQHAVPLPNWLDSCAAALPTRVIGCSSHYAAAAQAEMRPTRATYVVHAGARMPEPSRYPAPLALPPGVPIIGLVGRLQRWKGQDRMLRAAALLRERGQQFHLVLVGGDSFDLEPAYAASLPALIEELGLKDTVTMTGQVPDAGPYMEQLDVLVNASEPEPFGMVLLEAMARGIAVVAVDTGGPREILVPGVSGILARSGAPDALADALEQALASEEHRREIARAGRERFEREFTTAVMCRRMGELFRSLVGEHATPRQLAA
jgi:glycosyltransferase involved in cell wall biosynthesis